MKDYPYLLEKIIVSEIGYPKASLYLSNYKSLHEMSAILFVIVIYKLYYNDNEHFSNDFVEELKQYEIKFSNNELTTSDNYRLIDSLAKVHGLL